jgi:hypothetical protein
VAVATQLFPSVVPIAGVASGESFPDALAGGTHIALQGGPLLLTLRDSLPAAVATYLATRATERVVVYGGTNAIAAAVLALL